MTPLKKASFTRSELVLGDEALEVLSKSKVIVCGVGGVGGAACEALARSGVGTLDLIDGDTIEITNLNRQLVSLVGNIGGSKVFEMEKRIKQVAYNITVNPLEVMLTADNLKDYIGAADYVVDCIDDVPAKLALIVYCLRNKIPIVSSMGAGGRLDPSLLRIADISKTSIDPLARTIRRRLRKEGIEEGLTVVYSLEIPIKAKELKGKRVIGSSAFVPPAAGLILSSIVVRDLLDVQVSRG